MFLCMVAVLFCMFVLVSCSGSVASNTNEIDDDFAIDIARNCSYSLQIEFQESEVLPYEDVFYYYSCAACYTSDKEGIPFELIGYFDNEKMIFSVPYETVDRYLEKHFNTVPDKNSIDCYDSESEKYVFDMRIMESFYEYTVTEKEILEDGKYYFTVKKKHRLSDNIPTEYHSYVIQLTNDGYRILSRSIEKDF